MLTNLHSSVPSKVARSTVAGCLPSLVVDGVLLQKTLCAPHVCTVPPAFLILFVVGGSAAHFRLSCFCVGADPEEGTDRKHPGCAPHCVPEPAHWSPLVDLSVLQCQCTTVGLGKSKGLVDVEESRWDGTWSCHVIFFLAECVLPRVLWSFCVSQCLQKSDE